MSFINRKNIRTICSLKSILLISVLILPWGNCLFAQSGDSSHLTPPKVNNVVGDDSNEIDLSNFFEQEFTGHWAGICFGFNNLINRDYSTFGRQMGDFIAPQVLRSTTLEINPVQFDLGLQRYRRTIGLVSGAGLEFVDYRISPEIGLSGSNDRAVHPHYIPAIKNIKSKFSAIYVTIPLLLEFQIPVVKNRDRMYFSTGVIGKILVDSYTKEKYISLDDKKVIVKNLENYGLRDYSGVFTVRMGYRFINLFAEYGMNPLFREQGGPKVTPLTMGIALLL